MQKNTGLRRIRLAGVYACNGILAAFRHEAAFRQEVIAALVLLPLALLLDVSRVERLLLVVVTVLVMIVELLNSAVETVVDRVGVDHHTLSGRAKDMGSAAVLLTLMLWLLVWGDIVLVGVVLGR